MIKRLEARCLLSVALHHVPAKPTTFNFYAGAGTTNNAINAATAGGTLAPSAPALASASVTPVPLETNLTTADALNANAVGDGVIGADLAVGGTIAPNSIVIGTNSNVTNIYNFATGNGIVSVTNPSQTDATDAGIVLVTGS